MQTKYKYLTFEHVPLEKKKGLYECKNINSRMTLGTVEYYPQWRQYCYFPKVQAVYSVGCLEDIAEFIKQLGVDK